MTIISLPPRQMEQWHGICVTGFGVCAIVNTETSEIYVDCSRETRLSIWKRFFAEYKQEILRDWRKFAS